MQFSIASLLGQGATSKVYLAFDNSSRKLSALKVVQSKTPENAMSALRFAANEIQALARLEHKNIVKMYSFEEREIKEVKQKQKLLSKAMVLDLEYLPNGELFDILDRSGPLNEEVARFYFIQLIEGLECVHKGGFAHRDIKLENLLLDSDFNLKIADFGFSASIEQGLFHDKVGSFPYMAPEIYYDEPHYPALCDIFACGVALFGMLAGFLPFDSKEIVQKMFLFISNNEWGKFWKYYELPDEHGERAYFSDNLKKLFQAMADVDPQNRITIEEIKKSSWYNGKVASPASVKKELEGRRRMMQDLKVEKIKTKACKM